MCAFCDDVSLDFVVGAVGVLLEVVEPGAEGVDSLCVGAEPDPEPDAESAAEPEAAAEPDPEAVADPEADAEPEPDADADPAAEPEPAAEPDSALDADPADPAEPAPDAADPDAAEPAAEPVPDGVPETWAEQPASTHAPASTAAVTLVRNVMTWNIPSMSPSPDPRRTGVVWAPVTRVRGSTRE